MGFFLSKLLPLFVYPLGLAILAGIVVLALGLMRRHAAAHALLALTLVLLWIASSPAFSFWLTARLEASERPAATEAMPVADAIVLLGGFATQSSAGGVDLSGAVDRLFEARRLYEARRAPRIVISGGLVPWSGATRPEAELIADLLIELGIPRQALVLEAQSRNTHENAVNTAAIFAAEHWSSALLVTSGTHMPRALAAFRHAGLQVTPAVADLRGRQPAYAGPLDLLPSAGALARTTTAVKEMLGGLVYRALRR